MEYRENEDSNSDERTTLSICDVMRDSTNEVIMKMESLLPSHIESFANVQSEYIRIARDFFGTCYIAEKELLDKMGIDQKKILEFNKYAKTFSQYAISEIDMISNWQKTFVDNTISSMKVYDDYVKMTLEMYSKTLEQVSSMIPKKNK